MKKMNKNIVLVLLCSLFEVQLLPSFLLLSGMRVAAPDIGQRLLLSAKDKQTLDMLDHDWKKRTTFIFMAKDDLDADICNLVAMNIAIIKLNESRYNRILYRGKETFAEAKDQWKVMALEEQIKKIIEQQQKKMKYN